MGKKQLVINLFANIISFGTSLLISFVLTPYLISSIGKAAYSFYPMSNNFVSYLTIITVALNSMASRFITVEIVKNNLGRAKTYYSSVFFANVIMIGVLSIPILLIIIFINSLLNIPLNLVTDVRLLFSLIFGSMIISVITSVFGVATFAKNRLDLRSAGDIFQGLLKIGLFVWLFSQFKPSIVFVGLVALILSITNLFIQIIITRKLLPDFNLSYKYFDFRAVKELLASGIWNSINSLGDLLLMGVSLLLANIFLGASASGELSIVQILPQFISSIIIMLFSVFLPRITHIYAEGNKEEIVKEITFSQKVIGLFSSTPIVLIIIFGHDFFNLWVPNEDTYKLEVLSAITMIPLIIHGNMWTVYGLNIVLNKVRIPSLLLIVCGLLNVITCYIMLKYCISSIYIIPIVNGIISLLYYFFFVPTYASSQLNVKKYTFHIHIIKSLLYSTIIIIIGLIIKQHIVISTWVEFFLWGGIFGIVGLLCNTIFVLNKDDFKNLSLTFLNIQRKRQYKS